MKIVILCAGLGSRLNSNQPKGFIKIKGRTLLERTIKNFLYYKINKKDIFFATGFKEKLIQKKFGKKFKYLYNKKFRSTNMVYTLFNALKKIHNSDIIITYSDIIYNKKNILKLIKNKNSVATLVDFKWKKMWKKKNKLLTDSESLKIKKNKIIELGRPTRDINKIDGRYVGVIKISKDKLNQIKKLYFNSLKKNKKKFEKIDMTNFLNYLIKKKYEISPVKLDGSWNEYDDIIDLNYKYK
tara:strand:+ start:19 stop:741 length:723 start_codon:yes stop_codon:yes gene_type:complete